MSITRRSVLVAIPAMGMVPNTSAATDPLLETINAYRAGIKDFAAIPDGVLTKQNENHYVETTYRPSMKAIMSGKVEANSLSGVREAIRLALEEDAIDDRLAEGALISALAYLDRQAA